MKLYPYKTVQINVERNDIIRGEKNDPDFCPVTLALEKKLHHFSSVTTTHHIKIYDGKSREWYCATLPPKVVRFIYDFDMDRIVEPFSFSVFLIPDDDFIRQPYNLNTIQTLRFLIGGKI